MEFALHAPYPNPFNPSTTISYELPLECFVELSIFNVLGECVSTLVNNIETAGLHEVEWNASDMSSGMYFYRMKAVSLSGNESFSGMGKLLLVK